LIQEKIMTIPLAGLSLFLLLAGNEKSSIIEIKDAQLTLIEHADISARETGVLNHIFVVEGETVEANTSIALIDDQDAKLMQQRAETEYAMAKTLAQNDLRVRFAKKSLDVAKAELKRSLESVEKFPKSVSQTELDRLKLLADKAELDIEQAQFEMAQAKLTEKLKKHDFEKATLLWERRTIKAPFPGMVVQLKRQRGEWVEAATPVARLIRLNRLRAEGFVSSSIAPAKLVGRSATFLVEGIRHKGTLTYVNPEIDPVNQQVRVWAEVENEDLSLRPGQIGTLTIHEEVLGTGAKP
jgi:multidrug efflux pump subunit AcrA (membrane-fusion protein)